MPIFEFICDKCGHKFEEITSSSDASPQCPHCGASGARRMISACARYRRGNDSDSFSAQSSGGGCSGCSGGNCASCGH